MVGASVTVRTTLSKVALDQLAFAPVFSGLILSVIGAFQGLRFVDIRQKLEREYLDIILNGWKVIICTISQRSD